MLYFFCRCSCSFFTIYTWTEWPEERAEEGDEALYNEYIDLGVPPDQCMYIKNDDCTKTNCQEKLEMFLNRASASLLSRQNQDTTLVFYYGGHGIPRGLATIGGIWMCKFSLFLFPIFVLLMLFSWWFYTGFLLFSVIAAISPLNFKWKCKIKLNKFVRRLKNCSKVRVKKAYRKKREWGVYLSLLWWYAHLISSSFIRTICVFNNNTICR